MTIPSTEHVMEDVMSCLPISPEEEKRIVTELTARAESSLKEGNLYYVVSNRWYVGWQRYVGIETQDYLMSENSTRYEDESKRADRPGPIDNSDIILNVNDGECDSPEIIRTLQEGRDYVLVPEEVWEKLFNWYKGGPPLPRKLISQGDIYKQFHVEVYPLCLKLADCRDNSQSVIWLSKKATIRELHEKVCALKGLEQDKACVWDYFNKIKCTELAPSDVTLETANLQMDQDLLLEVRQNENASSLFGVDSTGNGMAVVPIEPSRSSMTIAGGPTLNGYSSSYCSSSFLGNSFSTTLTDENGVIDNVGSSTKRAGRGLAGLQNLGNTCFMNSALQCLVHTSPLVDYFLQDYSHEINKQNPLGMHGELAVAFGDLLRKMWSAGQTSVPPRVFKGKLARFAPQFSGYNQHDSQELLAFLLDGLHEDLNRVKKKPYIEMKDSEGRPDDDYAEECWKNHRARNDSIIVDTCQGQYKSTLVCPVCHKISIVFDPFMYLTLPLPTMVTRTMTVTVFYGDGSRLPMPYTVTVPKDGSCKDLILALGRACCLRSDESLVLAEVYQHKIFRNFDVSLESLSSIKDDEHIVAYRVPKRLPGQRRLEIIHQLSDKSPLESLKVTGRKLLGTPLITTLGEESQTAADIEAAIEKVLLPLKKSSFVCLSRPHSDKENGFASEVGDKTAITHESNKIGDEMADSNEKQIFGKFSFQVANERGCFEQVEEDYVIKPGQSLLKVKLDWTEKEHERYDVSFLEDLPDVCKSSFAAKKTRQEAINIFSCLEAFLKEEPLGPDDMWYCPSCKEHRQATKKLDLWKLPDILVIHLKRFTYSRYLKNKLDTFVHFPIHNLDLSKYVRQKDHSSSPYVYELYAVSNHYGGLGGGHYTAYAKLVDENRWYHFDDSHVSPVNEDEIRTSAAYLLFYRRVKAGSRSETGLCRDGVGI